MPDTLAQYMSYNLVQNTLARTFKSNLQKEF